MLAMARQSKKAIAAANFTLFFIPASSMSLYPAQRTRPLVGHVEPNHGYQSTGKVRCLPSEIAEPTPLPGDLLNAQCSNGTRCHRRQRQPDTETEHETSAKDKLFQLKAEQKS
jgi:hypothetical protein